MNLCNRLLKLSKEILLFLYDHDIPFTNNEAERDLRMTKVHLGLRMGPKGMPFGEAISKQ